MKQAVFLLIASLFLKFSIAQKIVSVPVVTQTEMKLNSTMRFGGDSRAYIPITLPANTIEWCYSFTTRSDGQAMKNIDLGIQLTKTLSKYVPNGAIVGNIAAQAVEAIIVPAGSMPVNAYVIQAGDEQLFKNGNQFRQFSPFSISSATQTKMRVTGLNNNILYLGLENKNSTKAALVTIEVVALVLENDNTSSNQRGNSSESDVPRESIRFIISNLCDYAEDLEYSYDLQNWIPLRLSHFEKKKFSDAHEKVFIRLMQNGRAFTMELTPRKMYYLRKVGTLTIITTTP